MATFKPRHYPGQWDPHRELSGVAQVDDQLQRHHSIRLSEPILRLAQAEYERQYPGQDYERIQERGGLSVIEVVKLLADYVERLGGEPTKPRDRE